MKNKKRSNQLGTVKVSFAIEFVKYLVVNKLGQGLVVDLMAVHLLDMMPLVIAVVVGMEFDHKLNLVARHKMCLVVEVLD